MTTFIAIIILIALGLVIFAMLLKDPARPEHQAQQERATLADLERRKQAARRNP